MRIDAPAIRASAIEKLLAGGYTIREAVTEAAEEDTSLDQTQRDFVVEILRAGLDRNDNCAVCKCALIGAERAFGTCGHCDRRSSVPHQATT